MSVIADFAREIGGPRVEVRSLVPLGVDPHTYEPTVSNARLLEEADLVLRNGLGLERWIDRFVETSGIKTVTVTDGALLMIQEEPGVSDPHLWMDPSLAIDYVEQINAALVALDPAGAAFYTDRSRRYIGELRALDEWIADEIEKIPVERRQLVMSHDSFRYYGHRYGIDVIGTIWGISTEREPSAAEIRQLVDAVRENQVPVVFVETTLDPRLMQRIARDAGVEVGEPLYGDSLGPPGSEADTYIRMMMTNTHRISTGLRE